WPWSWWIRSDARPVVTGGPPVVAGARDARGRPGSCPAGRVFWPRRKLPFSCGQPGPSCTYPDSVWPTALHPGERSAGSRVEDGLPVRRPEGGSPVTATIVAAAVRKAAGWLLRREKNVSKHVSLHQSAAATHVTRPWLLNNAAHSVF